MPDTDERDTTMDVITRAAKGPLHGAVWTLSYVDAVDRDANKFLDADQISHVIQQFESLAYEVDPTHPATQSVEPIDIFYELRDKGGILGKINFRGFFAVLQSTRTILVLGCFKKEAEDKTPGYIVARMRNRLRLAEEILARRT